MTAPTTQRPELNGALSEILGSDVPERVGVAWVAGVFGITRESVTEAIRLGKLPASALTDETGRVIRYSVRPGDALLVWGWRLFQPSKSESKST